MKRTRERSGTNPWIWSFALMGLVFLASCSTSQRPASRIIERSRQVTPDWVRNSPRSQGGSYYVYQKTRVFDLPLGLEQAQNSAVLDMQMQFRNRILGSTESLSPAETKALDRELQKVLKQHLSAKDIADIYFEKVELSPDSLSPLSENYYHIYVLCYVEQAKVANLVQALRKALEASGNAKLASAIKDQPKASQ